MAHGIAATSGHLSSNGGLRGHSVGEFFPFIVVGTGDDLWYVQSPAGWRTATVATAAEAVSVAMALKAESMEEQHGTPLP